MTPEVNAAAPAVLDEVGAQLDLLDVFGGKYARDYLAHSLGVVPRPRPPSGMHPRIAQALRDIAADEATSIRLYGPGRPRARQPRYPSKRISGGTSA